jgi:hypothetical protein
MGFEPTYDGFANHCLTAWLPHHRLCFAAPSGEPGTPLTGSARKMTPGLRRIKRPDPTCLKHTQGGQPGTRPAATLGLGPASETAGHGSHVAGEAGVAQGKSTPSPYEPATPTAHRIRETDAACSAASTCNSVRRPFNKTGQETAGRCQQPSAGCLPGPFLFPHPNAHSEKCWKAVDPYDTETAASHRQGRERVSHAGEQHGAAPTKPVAECRRPRRPCPRQDRDRSRWARQNGSLWGSVVVE